MPASPSRVRQRPAILFALVIAVFVLVSTASAEPIQVTGGSLTAHGASGYGPLLLRGDHGFTFDGQVLSGNYQPGFCNGSPCAATERISLFASWSGSDVLGAATLDGVTYPHVGSNSDISATSASLTVNFEGTVQLPHWGGATTLTAPFALTATLYHQGGPDTFVGSGMATIELSPITGYPQEYWAVTRVIYELGGRLPPPLAAADIGVVGPAGHTSQLRDSVVMIGAGTDIWATSDSFRFAYETLGLSARVSARVEAPRRVHPAAWHAVNALNPFAKSGVMIRESIAPDAASVFLGVKPDGELEFLARPADGVPTLYLGGATTSADRVWLALTQSADGTITASYSETGDAWTVLGSVTLPAETRGRVGGLAVTSHDAAVLAGALADHVTITNDTPAVNLLERGDFEAYHAPLLGPPGWVSDDLLRQVPAKSETHQPRSGAQNGACWTESFLDCGLYQEVIAPVTGAYTLDVHASADRAGGLVGVNVDGQLAGSREVAPRPFAVYERYSLTFAANAGDVIRVWMYSPATPGYVVIDDVSLVSAESDIREVSSGSWSISGVGEPFGQFDLGGNGFRLSGTYDGGEAGPLLACASSGQRCAPGDQVSLSARFANGTPVTFESFARGEAEADGHTYPFVEYGGLVVLDAGNVVLPAPADAGELVTVSAPFRAYGDVLGYEVLGLRDPRLVLNLPLVGRGIATLSLLASPAPVGPVVFRVFTLTYTFG